MVTFVSISISYDIWLILLASNEENVALYYRNQRGQNALKEMLQPLVMDVITDKNIRINTNPIEVYKVWVNQQESESGKTR